MKKHEHNNVSEHELSNKKFEYLKFAIIMMSILAISTLITNNSTLAFVDSFMGVFFIVFAGFKISKLKEFAYGFQNYDLIAKNNLFYAYAYPYIQLSFGLLYLAGNGNLVLDIIVIIISLISGAGVLVSLSKKQKVHCVCLGSVVKLPLSTISFIEDFGMAIMAFTMIIMR